MVPLPKKRYPKSRQGKRRSHLALKLTGLTRCPQCRTMRRPHHACPVCGFYNEKLTAAGWQPLDKKGDVTAVSVARSWRIHQPGERCWPLGVSR